MLRNETCETPSETFEMGERLGRELGAGDIVLLYGGLGAGKTLLTKGMLHSLDFEVDEVTSPSFSLVNLYRTPNLDVYHIDLWRLDGGQDVAAAVGLDEILENENAVIVIEWAERLTDRRFNREVISVDIKGDGDDSRIISITRIGP